MSDEGTIFDNLRCVECGKRLIDRDGHGLIFYGYTLPKRKPTCTTCRPLKPGRTARFAFEPFISVPESATGNPRVGPLRVTFSSTDTAIR